jgi:hypothetical protein
MGIIEEFLNKISTKRSIPQFEVKIPAEQKVALLPGAVDVTLHLERGTHVSIRRVQVPVFEAVIHALDTIDGKAMHREFTTSESIVEYIRVYLPAGSYAIHTYGYGSYEEFKESR